MLKNSREKEEERTANLRLLTPILSAFNSED
jgi:hypothetical protein